MSFLSWLLPLFYNVVFWMMPVVWEQFFFYWSQGHNLVWDGKNFKGRRSHLSVHYVSILVIKQIDIYVITEEFSQKGTHDTSKQNILTWLLFWPYIFECLFIAVLYEQFFIKKIWTLSNAECLQQTSRLKINNWFSNRSFTRSLNYFYLSPFSLFYSVYENS